MVFSRSQRGLSVVELIAVMTVAIALVLVSVPPLVEIARAARLRSAARRVVSDLQYARARAVSTGWQYRVAGFGAAASENANRYRIMARSLVSTDWPEPDVAPFQSDTQLVGEWVDLDDLFTGIALNADDPEEFGVTFDSAGAAIERSLNFDPLQVVNSIGAERFVSISAAGRVGTN
jgi:Tfp pilus assembly protein FimT